MRSITTKLVTLLALALGPVFCAGAAQKVNPLTQINWPLVTGTGAPSGSCTSSNYGQPYTNTANGNFYVCASSGWVLVAGGGGGGISGTGTTGFVPKFTGTTAIGNSAIDDGVTTANTITSTKPVAINDGTGVGGTVTLTEGTAASASAGKDILYADSTNHCIQYSANGGSFSCLGSGSGTPSGTNGVIQIANTAGTAFDSDSTISIDKTAHTVNIGTLPANHVSIGALGTPTSWNFDTTSPTTAAKSIGGGTAAANKYIDGGTGVWTVVPVQNVTGTSPIVVTPTSGTYAVSCPTCGTSSAALVNITASVTVSGCAVSGAQCVVGTPGATVSFSSIPGTYRTLLIRFVAGSSNSSPTDMYMQFNGDTATNYTRQFLSGKAGSPVAGQNAGVAQAPVAFLTGTTSPTGSATVGDVNIDLYASTTLAKLALSQYSTLESGTSAGLSRAVASVFWTGTAAVTQVTFGVGSGNITAGSSFSVYGIN